MRANEFITESSQQTTLKQLYGGNYPDRDEEFWDYVSSSEFDQPLTIETMQKHKVLIMLLSQYRAEHIDDITDINEAAKNGLQITIAGLNKLRTHLNGKREGIPGLGETYVGLGLHLGQLTIKTKDPGWLNAPIKTLLRQVDLLGGIGNDAAFGKAVDDARSDGVLDTVLAKHVVAEQTAPCRIDVQIIADAR